VVIGLLGAVLAMGARWASLAPGSALNLALETSAVAVTGLIAGWLGGAVLLLFLTLVTFAGAGTLAAALPSLGRDVIVGTCGVLLGKGARYVIAAFHERNRLRRRLQAHEAEVARAVAGYEAELQRVRHLVESAQRSSGHFVAMMSHEIRTALHGLIAAIDMLRDEPLSTEGRHRVAIARVSARALLNMANDILDLTRIEAGAFPFERKTFDLERVLLEVVDEVRAQARSPGLELRVSTEGALPRSVIGDPARVKHILTNLVSNALELTSAGFLTVRAGYDGARCTIDVLNTGPGGCTFQVTLPLEASAAEPLEEQPANQLIPGEHVVDADEMAARVLALPPLAGAVFEELWESLQWRVGPLRKIYDSFLSAARETLDMLNRATATGDGTVLARRLHSLLGSAGMVGARQVERVAAWLQEAVKADRRADLETGRVLLAESVRRFETELERRLDSLAR
jgi:signal transduction histidine kinase/HPt (histidine-containing phosphotransfer) domain-containing protein